MSSEDIKRRQWSEQEKQALRRVAKSQAAGEDSGVDFNPELAGLSYEVSLQRLANRFLLTLKERRSMVKLVSSESMLYPSQVRQVFQDFVDEMISTLAEYFSSLQGEGRQRKMSPEIAARAFLGIFFNYFRVEEIMKNRSISREELEKHVEAFVDIFVHGTLAE